jgi:hypothetical protein
VAPLTQAVQAYKQTHPGDDFALLQPREPTRLRRVPARFFAPLGGIDRLSACAPQEPPRQTLLGRDEHSATLRQFLGHRERVGADAALRPTRCPAPGGASIEGDGPRIASGSRRSRPKGQRTLLGRRMAGSHAVLAHEAAGQAVWVVEHPPAMPVSRVILAYGQQGALATGRPLGVLDRAVHSRALAWAFDAQGLGVLCRLDDNEPAGVESFEATAVDTLEEGTQV